MPSPERKTLPQGASAHIPPSSDLNSLREGLPSAQILSPVIISVPVFSTPIAHHEL